MAINSAKKVNGVAAAALREREPGWIKLMRSDETRELLEKDPLAFDLLCNLALRARWREGFDAQGLKLGQAMTGDYAKMKIPRQQYRTRLRRLQTWGFLTIEPTRLGSVVTLIGTRIFDIYGEGTNHLGNQRSTISHPTPNQQPASKEEGRSNKAKKESTTALQSAVEKFTFPPSLGVEEFKKSFNEWIDYRRGLRGTVKDWSLLFNKQLEWLEEFGPDVAQEILDQSIRNGWRGLFPPKTNQPQSRHTSYGKQPQESASHELSPGGEW